MHDCCYDKFKINLKLTYRLSWRALLVLKLKLLEYPQGMAAMLRPAADQEKVMQFACFQFLYKCIRTFEHVFSAVWFCLAVHITISIIGWFNSFLTTFDKLFESHPLLLFAMVE